jgi:hypothetical protein
MATHDDTLMRPRPKSTLLPGPGSKAAVAVQVVSNEPTAIAAPDRADPLPRPGDAYQAHARHANQPQMTLFLVGRDYLPDGFAYANLERVRMVDADKPGTPPLLVARFNGSVVTEVVMEGRHLLSVCNAIGLHLLPWVWEHPSPKDFADADAPLIKRFTVRVVENSR